MRTVVRTVGWGIAAGIIILGVGGRLLMRGVAVMAGVPPGFSMGGSLEVVISGALYGAIAGLTLLAFPIRLGVWRAIGHAAAVFLIIAVTSDAARSAASGIPFPARGWALLAFGILLVANTSALMSIQARRLS
jgi:hypothetical protein